MASFLARVLLARVGSGRADEGGDVLGGLAGELGQDAGVGVGGDGDGRQSEGSWTIFMSYPAATVKHALAQLRSEGLIISYAGKGSCKA
jgi:hypothetical protein